MEYRKKFSKYKRRLFKHIWVARFLAIFGVVVALLLFFYGIKLILDRYQVTQFVEPVTNFIFTTDVPVKNQDGVTNILVLGKGGEGHDAPELTDTIILASLSRDPAKITLISLPRDLYLADTQLKINHAFLKGNEQGGTEAGLDNARKTMEEVTGQTINYVTVVDFSGFTRLIDALGGINVEVERSFTDNRYPIAGRENDLCAGDPTYACRYETVSFSEGEQTMDGATALKFARSRHSLDPLESNDLARAARQQKIIDAIRRKVISTELIFNPQKVSELVSIGQNSVITDITPDEGAVLARIAFDARNNLQSYVLPFTLLYEPPVSPYRYFGQYVLLPMGASWNGIHDWVRENLN